MFTHNRLKYMLRHSLLLAECLCVCTYIYINLYQTLKIIRHAHSGVYSGRYDVGGELK